MHYDGAYMSAQSDKERLPEVMPSGLVLFRPGTDPARRRRRLIFLVIYFVAAAFLVWPIFPQFSGIHPLILGLPFSLAWVLLALAMMFAALVWLFRHEDS